MTKNAPHLFLVGQDGSPTPCHGATGSKVQLVLRFIGYLVIMPFIWVNKVDGSLRLGLHLLPIGGTAASTGALSIPVD